MRDHFTQDGFGTARCLKNTNEGMGCGTGSKIYPSHMTGDAT